MHSSFRYLARLCFEKFPPVSFVLDDWFEIGVIEKRSFFKGAVDLDI